MKTALNVTKPSSIRPISNGTPQELSFAERGVKMIAQRSRALLLSAPHLPKWTWGLADKYAVYLHDLLLPQLECRYYLATYSRSY